MKDRKESTKNAIDKFIKKQFAPESKREPRRQNKKPERDVQTSVLHWARDNGFYFHVIESSSYDPILRRKGSAKAQSGMPDLIGNTCNGLSCFVELKAKDRRSTLSESQRLFLEQKIDQNCFAVVVDSAEKLAKFWKKFCSLKSPIERHNFLKDSLPKKMNRAKPPRDKFEEDFGF